MFDYKKIEELKRDPGSAGSLARLLLNFHDSSWNEWEIDFLENISRRTNPLTTAEKTKLAKLDAKSPEALTEVEIKTRAALRDVAKNSEPLSTRQAEVLSDLEEQARRITSFEGQSVRLLILNCYLARADLDEDDAQYVEDLKSSGAASLRRRQLRKLLVLCRQVDIVEDYIGILDDSGSRAAW